MAKYLELNTFLKNLWVQENKKVTRKIKKYFELNENENRTYRHYGIQLKQHLGGMYTLETCICNEGRFQMNNLKLNIER